MKYFPLVWSAIWRKPTEAVLIWLAVTASFTLFGLMVGLHASYDQIIANARLDRIYVDARFPSSSATGILLPIAARDQIARVECERREPDGFTEGELHEPPRQRAQNSVLTSF